MDTLMTRQHFGFHHLGILRKNVFLLGTLAAASLGWLLLSVGMNATAGEIVLVNETFEGYSSFPQFKPAGDPVNLGVPTQAKGADSDLWMAARFEAFDDNPIAEDVGVQKFGGGGNNTHVGRMGDDAGLVLRLDLTGLTNMTLDFDWRTFQAETTDRLVVAYYLGDGLGLPNGVYDWFNDPLLGNGDMSLDGGTTNAWYAANWVELMRASYSNSFSHEHFNVTLDDPSVEDGVVYVAFWMDNGANDYGKIDNVQVMADYIPNPIPEPSTGILSLVAAAVLGWFRRRRR
jgi:PEP-CTERM motif